MGCVSSKQPVIVTPALDYSNGSRRIVAGLKDDYGSNNGSVGLEEGYECSNGRNWKTRFRSKKKSCSESGRASTNRNGSKSNDFRLGCFHKHVVGEHVAAGWPAWLSAVAGEAIQGWIPLRADSFEKLAQIGQGTYSSVFRARELETGKIVALKKVRFDNLEPESVQFMSREIMILRRLDHPNVMKLEGIITSRLSCSVYLVFEYMESDITGLISCPDVKFTEQQIKCYVKQLLAGLEHCHLSVVSPPNVSFPSRVPIFRVRHHSRGVLHRDIKGSNLLVNNEGILKVADFGLANVVSSTHKHPLTSRVVTLWYRPPELLLGATDYRATVDMWSVGCVFAELLLSKPILQGRTEVEQLHKIFKLCGSPSDDYWKKSKLPHATLFKPQQHYDSCLREKFKDFPSSAVNLIEMLLSVEPYKRGTASSALSSEFFTTEPYACEPSSLPIYPPNKEIDARYREEAKRKKTSSRSRVPDARKQLRKPQAMNKLAPLEDAAIDTQVARKTSGENVHIVREVPKSLTDKPEGTLYVRNASQGDIPFSGPLQVSTSSGGFEWAKTQKDDGSIIRPHHRRSISKGQVCSAFEPCGVLQARNSIDSKRHGGVEISSYESCSRSLQKKWSQFERPGSFDASDGYHSQELSLTLYQRDDTASRRSNLVYQDGDKVDISRPLLSHSQSHRIDELLEKHERQIRHAVRKSWFQQRGKR